MTDAAESPTRREVLKVGVGVAAGLAAGMAAAAVARQPARFRVAVTGDFENLALQGIPWNTLGDDAEVVAFTRPFGPVRATVRALREFDAVTLMHERVPLNREMIEQLPRLKLIVFSGNRNETLDDQAAAARGITVCRSNPNFDVPREAPGGESPAELTLALLLACTWQPGEATALIRNGGWSFRPGVPLRDKTLGILGYGGIGRPVARAANALGMRVLVFDRSLTEETARAENVTRADLATLLKNSDAISIHLPLTAATRGMIGREQIAQMKDGVILINTARGPIVDEPAFLEALRTRKIGMAGLDVYWEEPLPADHPLKTLPNVVMTPHIGYATADTMAVRYRALLETLAAYRQGKVIGLYSSRPVAAAPAAAPPDPSRELVSDGIPGVIAPGTRTQFLRAGFQGTEGAIGMPDGSVLFCEIDTNRIVHIDRAGQFSTYVEGSNRAIGLALDRHGELIAAQSREPRIGVLAPEKRTLADSFDGQPLVRPNDLVIDRHGGIYFSDPIPSVQLQFRPPPPGRQPLLFYITPQGQVTKLTDVITQPNGIQLSPDERTFYAVNGDHVVAFDVQRPGVVANPRRFATVTGDGMAIDRAGRLYVATEQGVQVVSPEGQLLGLIPAPVRIQSIAFAGAGRRTLFAVGRGAVYRIQLLTAGVRGRAK